MDKKTLDEFKRTIKLSLILNPIKSFINDEVNSKKDALVVIIEYLINNFRGRWFKKISG